MDLTSPEGFDQSGVNRSTVRSIFVSKLEMGAGASAPSVSEVKRRLTEAFVSAAAFSFNYFTPLTLLLSGHYS